MIDYTAIVVTLGTLSLAGGMSALWYKMGRIETVIHFIKTELEDLKHESRQHTGGD